MAMVTVTEWLGRPKRVSRRAIVLVAVSAAAAALIAYLVVEVPVAAPAPGGHLLLFCPLAPLPLPRGQISRHWPVALTGALVVLTVDALALWIALRRRRAPLRPRPAPAPAESPLR
ncbi:MAG: hypothetical protein JO181_17230, partial [Solirubrobacterales bacterium]|nr:hypothetical protein [Solirubrobacterales bacterium]